MLPELDEMLVVRSLSEIRLLPSNIISPILSSALKITQNKSIRQRILYFNILFNEFDKLWN